MFLFCNHLFLFQYIDVCNTFVKINLLSFQKIPTFSMHSNRNSQFTTSNGFSKCVYVFNVFGVLTFQHDISFCFKIISKAKIASFTALPDLKPNKYLFTYCLLHYTFDPTFYIFKKYFEACGNMEIILLFLS